MKRLIIIGAGGFGREVLGLIEHINGIKRHDIYFMESDEIYQSRMDATGSDIVAGVRVLPLSAFNKETDHVIIAIGEPDVKRKIAEALPETTKYQTLIHPSAIIGNDVKIGKGCIICAGCILTCDINIGDFITLNIGCTVGHDVIIHDYCSLMPSVNVSGGVNLWKGTYIGTNSCIKQGVTIEDGVVIGMGSVVTKDITEKGVYVGSPAKKIK